MTREEVDTLVAGIGLPYAYYQFKEGTKRAAPYIIFFYSLNRDIYADNSNFVDREQLNIELYTKTRDFDLEKTVEDVLKLNGFSYYKEYSYIDSEHIWQIAYEMEVIINE